MASQEFGSVVLALLLLLLGANLLGQLFGRLRQPKVVGEILAGIFLGPTLLGYLAPRTAGSIFGNGSGDPSSVVLGFMYHLGLLMLMFVSGFSVRHVLGKENRKPTAWILAVGTPLPFFIALGLSPWLPIDSLVGEVGSHLAVVIVFAIATAVTSIPVITKIFYDLDILHTRFASLMLGVAVFEDIILWGVLAVATAIAAGTLAATQGQLVESIAIHVVVNTDNVFVALIFVPPVLRRLGQASWNVLARESPVAWIIAVLLGYVVVAAALGVTLVFAAFLAGFGIVGGMKATERQRFRRALDSIEHLAVAVFIPIYFALVGYRLDLRTSLDPMMLVGFLVGTSLLVFATKGLAARLGGFRGLDVVNLTLTCNARGGPGIVLASVAFDAGIINAPFFTTLVLTAVFTSQACGFWLDYVLRKGWPLLSDLDLRRRGMKPAVSPAVVPAHDGSWGQAQPAGKG
jgi:Kef-type K+ transport system membrane component KefB